MDYVIKIVMFLVDIVLVNGIWVFLYCGRMYVKYVF